MNGPVLRSRSGVSAYTQAGGLFSLPGGFSRYHHPAVPPCHHHKEFWLFIRLLIIRQVKSLHSASPFQFGSTSRTLFGPCSLSPFGPTFTSCVVVFRVSFRFFPTLPNPVYVSFSDFFTPFSFIACHYVYTSRSYLSFFACSTSHPTFASPSLPRLSRERGSIGGNPSV